MKTDYSEYCYGQRPTSKVMHRLGFAVHEYDDGRWSAQTQCSILLLSEYGNVITTAPGDIPVCKSCDRVRDAWQELCDNNR